MSKIIPCECGSCPVLERTESGTFRAGCPNEDCIYYGLYTLADREKDFVLEQWNVLTEIRKNDD